MRARASTVLWEALTALVVGCSPAALPVAKAPTPSAELSPTSELARRFRTLSDEHWNRSVEDRAYRQTLEGTRAPSFPLSMTAIPEVIELARAVGNTEPDLARAMRAWLLAQVAGFASAYSRETELVAALPSGSRWHRAEAAWIAWLNASLPTLADEEKEIVGSNVFVPAPRASYPQFDHSAFPGFDPFLFGLREAELGKAARRGLPVPGWLFTWSHYSTETPDDRARLASALIGRRDDMLTDFCFLASSTDGVVDFLHRVEPSEPTFEAALKGFAIASLPIKDFAPVFRHLWHEHPAARGRLLFIMAIRDLRRDVYRDPAGSIGWTSFQTDYDGGATRADIQSFFAEGAAAVPASRWLFSARAQRISFVDLLIPRLDSWLDAPGQGGIDGEPFHGLAVVIHLVCEDHDEQGMAQLREYFAQREIRHPDTDMRSLMAAWPPGSCAP